MMTDEELDAKIDQVAALADRHNQLRIEAAGEQEKIGLARQEAKRIEGVIIDHDRRHRELLVAQQNVQLEWNRIAAEVQKEHDRREASEFPSPASPSASQ